MEMLLDILSMRREHNSNGELNFIGKYLTPLKSEIKFDDEGNVLAYVVDNSKGKSTVMWTAHIDTMHRNNTKEPDRLTQEVWVDEEGMAFVTDKEDCLGADDGAGVWLLLEMIKADCAGTYVFFRGEEKGCWGSSRVAVHHEAWLTGFTHAIAFDRRGTKSIITHQTGSRACSDAFALQFSALLNMEHEADPTGVYTDTAEFMSLIPECVNVSCGYYSEHSSKETLDTTYMLALRDAMCVVDWLSVSLPVDRDPAVYEGREYGYNYGSSWGSYTDKRTLSAYPTNEEFADANMPAITAWVRKADVDDIAAIIQDMAHYIESLQFDNYKTAEDDDYDYLDVGMR